MKFFIFLFSFLFPFLTFAQETIQTNSETTITPTEVILPLCSDKFLISGPAHIKANTAHEFILKEKNSHQTELPFGKFILQGEDTNEEQSVEREKFVYSFSRPGVFSLRLQLNPMYECRGEISQNILVYREMIYYLGNERPDLRDESLLANFREKSVLLKSQFDDVSLKAEDSLATWTALGEADIIVLNSSDILRLFANMEKLQRIKENSFAKTKFFIISQDGRAFLSKVLASSVNKLGIQSIFLITENNFNSLLYRWGYEDSRQITEGEYLSYEKKGFVFSMSSVLEYLVYAGVSYQFLGFLLVLALVALVFNILKQVIGMGVFMIYYPLLLALIFSQFGISFTTAFIVISFFAVFVIRFITSYLPLLVNARKAVLISVYILLIFLALGIDNVLGLNIFRYTGFESSISIVTIFMILLIIEKAFDDIKIFSKSGILHIFQYAIVVTLATLIFTYKELQYFLISYPDLIFLIVIANLLVGRYMGLQIAEYIRFSPILRNISEEE